MKLLTIYKNACKGKRSYVNWAINHCFEYEQNLEWMVIYCGYYGRYYYDSDNYAFKWLMLKKGIEALNYLRTINER